MKEKIAEDVQINIATYKEQQHLDVYITMDLEIVTGDKIVEYTIGDGFNLLDVPESLMYARIKLAFTTILNTANRYILNMILAQKKET